MTNRELYFQSKWFSEASPLNPKEATGTLTFSGVVSDEETVVIDSNTYEFDHDNTITEGNIKVDMTNLLPQATATLTFSGIPVVAETITIGAAENIEVYELVADAEDIADPANIPVVLGTTLTADNAVMKLTEAINANSELVTATGNTTNDTVVITAIAGGTGANTMAIAETCTNATFGDGVTTLSGGANTITATDAVTLLIQAINTHELLIIASESEDDSLTVEYNKVGTAGNAIEVSTTCVNGSWGEDVTVLSGGQYGTPCPIKDTIVYVSPYYYWCEQAGNKDDVVWKRFTPAAY